MCQIKKSNECLKHGIEHGEIWRRLFVIHDDFISVKSTKSAVGNYKCRKADISQKENNKKKCSTKFMHTFSHHY